MKKVVSLLLAISILFMLAACGTDAASTASTDLESIATASPSSSPTPMPSLEPKTSAIDDNGFISTCDEYLSFFTTQYSLWEQAALDFCDTSDGNGYKLKVSGIETTLTINFTFEGGVVRSTDLMDTVTFTANEGGDVVYPAFAAIALTQPENSLEANKNLFENMFDEWKQTHESVIRMHKSFTYKLFSSGQSICFTTTTNPAQELLEIPMDTSNDFALDFENRVIYDGENFAVSVSDFLNSYSNLYSQVAAISDGVQGGNVRFELNDALYRIIVDETYSGIAIGFAKDGNSVAEGDFDQITLSGSIETYAEPFTLLLAIIRADFSSVTTKESLAQTLIEQTNLMKSWHETIEQGNTVSIYDEQGITYRYGFVPLGTSTMVILTVSTVATPIKVKELDDSDFIITGTAAIEYADKIVELNSLGEDSLIYVYYDPIEDSSKEEVVTTARGIQIGDSKNSVIEAYGSGTEGVFDMYNDSFYLIMDDLQGMMRAQCVSYISYYDTNGYGIHFYFDDDDEVSWVFFSN